MAVAEVALGARPARPTPPPRSTAAFLAAAAVVAGVVAAALAALSTTQALVLLGLPDPGVLTTYGLPLVTAVGEVAAVLAIGFLLLAAFLVPPQRSGVLDVDGYRALRAAGTWSMVWCACAALLIPLSLSDASGQPLRDALSPRVIATSVGQVEASSAWAWTAGIAFVLAIGCRAVLRWGWTPLLFALGLASLLPLGLSGHSSAGGSHDIATNSLILHISAAAIWAGGLAALLAHARRGGTHTDVATRRFSATALVMWIVLGVTGVLNAAVRMPASDLVTTTYGRLVLAKAAALAVLGVFGYLHRRRSVTALAADPAARGPLIRLAAVEVLLLTATVGLAVGLSRTPPPDDVPVPTLTEVELGYDLAGPPTPGRLIVDWRFDLVFGTAALVLAAAYVVGVLRLRRRGDRWPVGRMVAWLLGCLTLLFVTSSGVGRYSTAVFSVHMSMHMVLSMLVPVLLVLGGPVTLALRALPTAGRDGVPGPREWLVAALNSRITHFLANPFIALALFVGSFFGLYFSGLFDIAISHHSAHVLMNAHFLLSGYLFYWLVIGVDPAPRPLPPLGKLGLVLAALPFHAFFGIILMGTTQPLGAAFYRSLGLAWNGDLIGDQHLGGGIAWATGELPLVLVMLALLIQWSRTDEKVARRLDRRADADDDADLAAHNAMFAELNRNAP